MGLSNALSGGIIMVALISVLLTVPGIVGTTSIVQDASTDISNIEESIRNTNIKISYLSATSGSDLIEFTVNNMGDEKLWDYDKFNLIISYDETSSLLTESLSYAGECSGDPNSGFWCNDGISTDTIDPGILNYYEQMNIKAKVANNVATGIVIVVMSTDNGVTTSTSTTT